MTETQTRARAKEPSHLDLLSQINARFDNVEARLERGETRFDRLEAKIDAAEATRAEMASDVKVLQATTDANKTPPWWLGPRPVAIALTLAALAGAGMTALAIAGLDIVPKLTAIKEAVQP
jgi:hypothetical protein